MFDIFHSSRASCGNLTCRQEGHYCGPHRSQCSQLGVWYGGRTVDHPLSTADGVASLRKAGYGWAERKTYKISMALPIVN